MKPADALSKDARALLRAARGGDDIPAAERQRVLEAFRQRAAVDEAVDAAASVPRLHAARASHSGQRRALPRPVRRVAWALAAVISTGSLAALAREGAFDGWGAALERMLGTLAGERSTPAAHHVPPAGAAETDEQTSGAAPAAAGELVPAAGPPARLGSSPDAERPLQPAGDGLPAVVAPEPLGPRPGTDVSAPAATEAATAPDARASAARAPTGSNEPRRRLLPSTATRSSEDIGPTRDGASGTAHGRAARPQTSTASGREPAGAASAGPAVSHTKAPAPDASSVGARASDELDLIVTARNALASRRHADARAAAERHAHQFPNGVFAEEREAILALCACRETGARERARGFVERRPDSLFAERIREDCKLVSNLVPGEPPAGTH